MQLNALKAAGCEKIFHDEMSGVKADRPGLQKALDFARSGDTVVVWRLDRLGRSLRDLIDRVEGLKQRKVDFKSRHENIDTTTPSGKLQFHVFSALAEFERDMIRERTMAGLRAASARGVKGGRKREMTPEKVEMAATLMKDKSIPIDDICNTLGITRTTLYRYVGPGGIIRKQ